jgi:hypothetical protein
MASRGFQTLHAKGKVTLHSWSRLYHSAVAKFTTVDPKGMPISRDTGIMIGGPDENFIYIEPEVGNAIRSAVVHQLGSDVLSDPKTLSLQFNHKSKNFTYSKYLWFNITISSVNDR